MKDDAGRLQDMLEAIQKVESRLDQGHDAFVADELLQVWAVHHLSIIGEAASRLSDALRAGHPEVAWAKIVGMRNVLIHDYVAIDIEIVWLAVERDLPALKRQIQTILTDLSPHS